MARPALTNLVPEARFKTLAAGAGRVAGGSLILGGMGSDEVGGPGVLPQGMLTIKHCTDVCLFCIH